MVGGHTEFHTKVRGEKSSIAIIRHNEKMGSGGFGLAPVVYEKLCRLDCTVSLIFVVVCLAALSVDYMWQVEENKESV